jgi:DNA repair ATPase RecN
MNGFIQKVFPYMSVKLQQNRTGVEFYYTPNVSEEDSWVSVKMASGAQVSILSLAWRISIARIYGITTLLLDEIDESSTEENSRLIYEFIASLTTFDQIFLISHKKEAIRAISAMADNVVCYEVSEGIYTEVNPENIE